MTTSPGSGEVTDFAQYTLPQLSQMLFEVRPTDPLTYVAIAIVLAATAAVAAWWPARRAASVDPMVALRSE